MIVSRSDRIRHSARLTAVMACAGWIGAAGITFAQGVTDGQVITPPKLVIEAEPVTPIVQAPVSEPVTPQPLIRQPLQLAPARPLTPLPPPEIKSLVVPLDRTPAGKVASGIAVGALGAVNPDDAGPLLPLDGGLGTDMWVGTNRELAERLLARIPAGSTSPVVRGLIRRLLLSAATAPQFDPVTLSVASQAETVNLPEPAVVSGDFVTARVDRLMSMGEVAAVIDLLHTIPNRTQFPKLARVEADTLLMSNDLARSCALAGQHVEQTEAPFWRTIFIFCQALAEQHDMAAMGAGLLREAGYIDPTFYALLDRLANGPPVAPADDDETAVADETNGDKAAMLSSLRPIHFAMMRAAKARLPAEAAWSNDVSVLRAVAVNPGLDAKTRAEAAERAEAAGVLRTGVLRHIYASIEFDQADLAAPLTRAQSNPDALSRALLYQAATAQTVPTALAEVIDRSLALAREGGRYQSGARVFGDILSNMRPSSELVWFAPTAARAALAVGDVAGGKRWLAAMRRRAGADQAVSGELADLRLLARIAGPAPSSRADEPATDGVVIIAARRAAWDPQWVIDWQDRHADDERFAQKAIWMGTLLTAFGDTVPSAFWTQALDGPAHRAGIIPQASVWNVMEHAVDGARRAEGLSWVLIGLGQSNLTDVDPMFLRRALNSLSRLGLERDARALALEVAVAAGL